ERAPMETNPAPSATLVKAQTSGLCSSHAGLVPSKMTSPRPNQTATDTTASKQANGSLGEIEGRLHAIFENMSQGIVTSDFDGNLLFWNRAAVEMHGFTSSEELKTHFLKFIDLFELSTLDGQVVKFQDWPLARLLRGERLSNYDLNVRRLDKDWRR